MDTITKAALQSYRPSLEAALVLLREAESLQPATNAGYEKLLAARCQLEQVLGLSKELAVAGRVEETAATVLANIAAAEGERGDQHQRHARELQHHATLARMYAQSAAEELRAAAKEADPIALELRLSIALGRVEQIDELHRNGVCRCPRGACEFGLSVKPLRKVVSLVKQPLRAVRDDEQGPGAA